MILTEINKVALQCKNKLPFPALRKLFKILLKSLEECNSTRRGFHDLIAQWFSTIFSAGCCFLDYTK